MLILNVQEQETGNSSILMNFHMKMILIFAKRNVKNLDQNVQVLKCSLMMKVKQVLVDLEVVL